MGTKEIPYEIVDCRVHGPGVTLPLHGRYKAVTLRSCNVDPCIRTRISRGFQNCAQIDLNQHEHRTCSKNYSPKTANSPAEYLPSTCEYPPNFMEFKRSLEMSQSLIHGPAPVRFLCPGWRRRRPRPRGQTRLNAAQHRPDRKTGNFSIVFSKDA